MKKAMILFLLLFFYVVPYFINGDVLFIAPEKFRCGMRTYPFISSDCVEIYGSTGINVPVFYLTAPIQLPEGAKITSMVIFFMDNQSNSSLRVRVVRQNRYSGGQDTIISKWISTDGSDTYRLAKTTSVNYQYNKILNNSCTYHIAVSFRGGTTGPYYYKDLKLYGVKIFYMPPAS